MTTGTFVDREYGSKLLDASDSNLDYAPVRNLTYSQAVILLGVPKEGREQFIIDMDIGGMTNQELRKAVNERTQTRQEKTRSYRKKTRPSRRMRTFRKQWKTKAVSSPG